jgi:hypothetical protein
MLVKEFSATIRTYWRLAIGFFNVFSDYIDPTSGNFIPFAKFFIV